MMTLLILVGVALIFLVLGLVFLAKGLKGEPEKENVVPITNIDDIKHVEGISEFQDDEKFDDGTNADTIQEEKVDIELEKEDVPEDSEITDDKNLQEPVVVSEEIGQLNEDLERSRQEIERLKEENKKLNEALSRELSVKGNKGFSEEEKKLLEEKDEEINNLNHAIEGYIHEIRNLRDKQDEYRQKVNSERDFDKEIELLTQDKDDLNALIERLRNDIELKDKELLGQKSEIDNERQELILKISEHEKKLTESEGIINSLNAQINVLKESQFEPDSKDISERLINAEDLKLKNQQLIKEVENISSKLTNAQEHNNQLMQKESMLKNELTKSRAQALGLEKICDDFKVKLEQGSK